MFDHVYKYASQILVDTEHSSSYSDPKQPYICLYNTETSDQFFLLYVKKWNIGRRYIDIHLIQYTVCLSLSSSILFSQVLVTLDLVALVFLLVTVLTSVLNCNSLEKVHRYTPYTIHCVVEFV